MMVNDPGPKAEACENAVTRGVALITKWISIVEQEPLDLHYLQTTVNGESVSLWVEPGETLLGLLRERLQLFGTKAGCQRGECGACTVLLDEMPIFSCMTLAVQAHEKNIVTIEGLQAENGGVHVVQRAFIEHNAVQCGFCTPGMILTVAALLKQNHAPSDREIQRALEGHLCRCGAHSRILEAIDTAKRESQNDVP